MYWLKICSIFPSVQFHSAETWSEKIRKTSSAPPAGPAAGWSADGGTGHSDSSRERGNYMTL